MRHLPHANSSRLTRYAYVLLLPLLYSATASADTVYSNLPDGLPPNLPSLGYQATSTTEFGDHIAFAPGARKLNSVTITMSNWALASTYGSQSAGYNHDLTFNIYNYSTSTVAGSLIASRTLNAFIPWRPQASTGCGTAWLATNGQCYSGLAFNINFDFSSLNVILPDEIVFGLSFNTNTWGNNPIGQNGPYESLNYALVSASPSVGTDVNHDAVFWNTAHQGFLTTGAAGVFGEDIDSSVTGWSGYVPSARFDASTVPEPTSLALLGLGLFGLSLSRKRKQK